MESTSNNGDLFFFPRIMSHDWFRCHSLLSRLLIAPQCEACSSHPRAFLSIVQLNILYLPSMRRALQARSSKDSLKFRTPLSFLAFRSNRLETNLRQEGSWALFLLSLFFSSFPRVPDIKALSRSWVFFLLLFYHFTQLSVEAIRSSHIFFFQDRFVLLREFIETEGRRV